MTTTGSERPTGRVPSLDSFGARLALLRHELGLNTVDIAAQCGVLDQSWRNWESGMKPRDIVKVARQIAEATGVDLSWLLLGPLPGDAQIARYSKRRPLGGDSDPSTPAPRPRATKIVIKASRTRTKAPRAQVAA